MARSFRRTFILTLMLTAVATAAVGCSKKPADVIAVWPEASTEATVAAPPVPITWPLTGLPAPSEAATHRRPLSIKVENSPAARPQTGLNSADVAYETVTEGGITRFHLIFQSKLPKIVGPVRSARLSDLWVVPQYHGLFFYSGDSSYVSAGIRSAHLPNLSQDAGVSTPYSRSSARPAPHNLYLNTAKAYEEAKRRKYSITGDVPELEFGLASVTTSGTPVKSVYIPFSGFNNVTWTWNAKDGVWLRENNHRVHRDAQTGKQVAAKNVVVMWARYTAAVPDHHGGMTYDLKLGGEGRATIFRDGRYYDGKWLATRTSPPHFVDRTGKPIKLAPGNTWMQVINLNVNITMR